MKMTKHSIKNLIYFGFIIIFFCPGSVMANDIDKEKGKRYIVQINDTGADFPGIIPENYIRITKNDSSSIIFTTGDKIKVEVIKILSPENFNEVQQYNAILERFSNYLTTFQEILNSLKIRSNLTESEIQEIIKGYDLKRRDDQDIENNKDILSKLNEEDENNLLRNIHEHNFQFFMEKKLKAINTIELGRINDQLDLIDKKMCVDSNLLKYKIDDFIKLNSIPCITINNTIEKIVYDIPAIYTGKIADGGYKFLKEEKSDEFERFQSFIEKYNNYKKAKIKFHAFVGKVIESLDRHKGYITIGEKDIIFDKIGMSYILTISKYTDDEEAQNDSSGIVIRKEEFRNYLRYYFGLHFGFYFPLKSSLSYKFYGIPENSVGSIPFNGQYGIMNRTTIKNISGVGIIAIYPIMGYMPDVFIPNKVIDKAYFASVWKNIYRGLQINLGFELSDKIFSKIYLGAGLSVGFVSLHFLACYEKNDLPRFGGNYQILPIQTYCVSPIVSNGRWTYGISLALPLDFASALIIRAAKAE